MGPDLLWCRSRSIRLQLDGSGIPAEQETTGREPCTEAHEQDEVAS